MPTLNDVLAGSLAQAVNVQQIIDALKGTPSKGVPIALVSLNDSANYALSVQNDDPTNSRALSVLKSDGTTLISADATGVTLGGTLHLPTGSISSAMIQAGAATASVVQGAFLNPTTTSTSPVAVPGLTTPSLTCFGARPVVVTVTTSIQFGAITQNANLFLARDGVSLGCLSIGTSTAASEIKPMAFTYLDLSVVAGGHTWGLMWSTSAGTISMVGAAFSSVTATELRV